MMFSSKISRVKCPEDKCKKMFISVVGARGFPESPFRNKVPTGLVDYGLCQYPLNMHSCLIAFAPFATGQHCQAFYLPAITWQSLQREVSWCILYCLFWGYTFALNIINIFMC